MPDWISKTLIALAAMQVVAGALGGLTVLVTLLQLGAAPVVPPLSLVAVFEAALFFGANVWAGIELWRGSLRGIALSIGVQAVQIVRMLTPGFSFRLLAGPELAVSLHNPLVLNVGVDLGAFVIFTGIEQGWLLGVNGVAVAAVWILDRAWEAKAAEPTPPEPPVHDYAVPEESP